MKRPKKNLFYVFLILPLSIFANNIQVSNVTLGSKNTTNDYYMIEFDLSWENSWRTSSFESNWDAAWVFIKATIQNQQEWTHGFLNYVDGTNDGHIAAPGSMIQTAVNTYGNTSLGIGAFIYRSADGIGDVNFEAIELRWNYGDSGFNDDDIIDISVTAVEMVYVPEGGYYLGDGMGDFGQFELGTSGSPYLISNENSLTLGGGAPSSLGNNNAANMQSADDFNDAISQTLPAEFPKGYKAFYCMKYEASQSQYASFLAHLNQTQRGNRTEVIYVNNINVYPIAYGNHYADADHPWRAMDYAAWSDVAAYLDWAGLRPMSEMEYEKACRGTLEPIPEEYAWGNDSWYLEGLYTLQAEGTNSEIISDGIGTHVGNGNSVSIYQGWSRPLRCGIFAASAENKTRQETGATYWGIMEMTGNCYERVISVGNSQSRDFSGIHGDGLIRSTGDASFSILSNWGFVSAIGVGFRNSEISQRYLINTTDSDRNRSYGIRGVRYE